MNNYSSLRIVSKLFKVIAWIIAVVGTFTVLFAFRQMIYYNEPLGGLMFVGTAAFYTFIGVVFSFAISELILLTISAAGNLENIKDNVFYLATKKEEEMNKSRN